MGQINNKITQPVAGMSLQINNPLLMTPVLQHLVKNLSLPDLKTGRLVCRSWKDHFRSRFTSMSKVILPVSKYSENSKFNDLLLHIASIRFIFFTALFLEIETMTAEIKHLLSSCQGQLTELHIEERYEKMIITFSEMQNIFISFGSQLVKLTICLPSSSDSINTLNSSKSILFPKLESLRLIGYTVRDPFFNHSQQTLLSFFTELFAEMPKLQKITLDVRGKFGPCAALSALTNLRIVSSLTYIETSGWTDTDSMLALQSLARKAVKLEVLKLFLWTKDEGEACRTIFLDILKSRPKSLKELHVIGIGGYMEPEYSWFFQKNVLEGFDKIRVVLQHEAALCRFVGGIDPIRFAKSCTGIQIQTRPETKISSSYSPFHNDLLQCLSNCYNRGAVSIQGKFGSGYCSLWSWTNLRVLDMCIEPYEVDRVNLDLLGVTAQELSELQKLKQGHQDLAVRNNSIANLKGLQILKIRFAKKHSLDTTGYFALAKMKWLKELELRIGVNCMSSACQNYIRKQLSTTKVSFISIK